MHPAFSVIFLTTLIGMGQGLFLALYTGQIYSLVNVLPATTNTANFYGGGILLAVIFLGLGLLASFFHLGHPERGWRAIARWRTSWLSREVIVLPAVIGLTSLYGLIHYSGFNPIFITIGQNLIPIDLSIVVGALNTILVFTLFLCTGMIYACIKFLQEWATPLTVVNFTLLGSASGFTVATAYSAFFEPSLMDFFGGWAVFLTLLALVTRTASLIRNRRLQPKSTLQTAIGIRHPQIVQKAQGAMGGSFNTREYWHGKSISTVTTLQGLYLVLVFFAPILFLSLGMNSAAPALLVIAVLLQYTGLLAERWVFFAQANHPQNLYYQTV